MHQMPSTEDGNRRIEGSDQSADFEGLIAPAREGVAVTIIDGEFFLVVPKNGHLIGPMPLREIEEALDAVENAKGE